MEIEDKYGVRSLHLACTRGPEMVKVLLQQGANINAPDQVGNTPIFHTILNDDVDAMKVLLDHATKMHREWHGVYSLHGSKVIRNTKNFELLLHHAVEHELLSDGLLENRQQSINLADSKGRTPLHIAAEYGRTEYARQLIENGANVNLKDQQGRTPFDLATSDAMIELLIINKAAKGSESLNQDTTDHQDPSSSSSASLLHYKSSHDTFDFSPNQK